MYIHYDFRPTIPVLRIYKFSPRNTLCRWCLYGNRFLSLSIVKSCFKGRMWHKVFFSPPLLKIPWTFKSQKCFSLSLTNFLWFPFFGRGMITWKSFISHSHESDTPGIFMRRLTSQRYNPTIPHRYHSTYCAIHFAASIFVGRTVGWKYVVYIDETPVKAWMW